MYFNSRYFADGSGDTVGMLGRADTDNRFFGGSGIDGVYYSDDEASGNMRRKDISEICPRLSAKQMQI